MVDVPLFLSPHPEKEAILKSVRHSQRKFFRCGKNHGSFGNQCRWNAFDKASGEYIIYLDDDDYLADNQVFETLNKVTAMWAIFPIMRCGQRWFCDPPGLMKTGSGMFIYKRETGERYPNIVGQPGYCADGHLVEALLKNHPYQALKDERPLMIYEKRGMGKE